VHEPDLPILDEATLSELKASVDGDAAFVVELIETYLADSPIQIAEIDKAITADDAAALIRPAHTLKSSSATVGAQRLATRSRRLEEAGRSGSIDDDATRNEVKALHTDWQAAADALRRWIAGGVGR
jgi:FOG: HPt domain